MKVVIAPDPRLRVKTKQVKKITPELIKLGRAMIKFTQSFIDPQGMGLSTNQIGRDEKFFVAKLGKDFIMCFNPQIISQSPKKKVFFEGCLSIPDYYGEVKRPISIKAMFDNEGGKKITKTFSGISSWIFQHEVDHLNGILFMDHVLKHKGRVYKFIGKDRAGGEIFEEVTL